MRWLSTVEVVGDRLVIPSDGWAPTASAGIGPDALHLDLDPLHVDLGWDPWEWSFSWWTVDRGGEHGLAVNVRGSAVDATSAMREECTTRWRILNRINGETIDRPVTSVPVIAGPALTATKMSERLLLTALCQLLATRPEVRERMHETNRLERLLKDMVEDTQHHRRHGGVSGGIRPKTVEVETELRAIGLTHPLQGRPVPGDPLRERAEVIEEVVERVARHPFAAQMRVTADHVARVVDRDYYDADPWPFGSLTLP